MFAYTFRHMSDPGELRIADVVTFLTVSRLKSVTGAARDLKVTPSQVSKAVSRLERHVGMQLLVRKARRVSVSEEAGRLVPKLETLLQTARSLTDTAAATGSQRITVAAPSYLSSAFLPVVIGAAPDTRVRALEVGPAFMRAYATENLFDLAVTIGAEKLPGAWTSVCVGTVRRALFASPALARTLGPKPTLAELSAVRFIMPVYNSGGEFMPGDDGCPIPRSDRAFGHESSTIGVGLELASQSEQLVFGPVIAARHLVAAGKLVEIRVPGWRLTDDLYLHANADRVLARTQRAIAQALRSAATAADVRRP